jgi:hypothetical protein
MPNRKLQRFLRWLVFLRGSPEAIARGVAIGVFVAFTPTIGIQVALAAFLATLLNANRPAAMVPVWITNPLTISPIFGFTYVVGSWLCPGPSSADVAGALHGLAGKLSRHEFWDMSDQLREVLSLSRDVLFPLSVGGVLVGLVGSLAAYALTLRFVSRSRRRDG